MPTGPQPQRQRAGRASAPSRPASPAHATSGSARPSPPSGHRAYRRAASKPWAANAPAATASSPNSAASRDPGPIAASGPLPLASTPRVVADAGATSRGKGDGSDTGRGRGMAGWPRREPPSGALLRRGCCRSARAVGRRRRRAGVPAFRRQAVPGAGAGRERCRRRVRASSDARAGPGLRLARRRARCTWPWSTPGWRGWGWTSRRSPAARTLRLFAPAAADADPQRPARRGGFTTTARASIPACWRRPASWRAASGATSAPDHAVQRHCAAAIAGSPGSIACPSPASTAAACPTIRCRCRPRPRRGSPCRPGREPPVRKAALHPHRRCDAGASQHGRRHGSLLHGGDEAAPGVIAKTGAEGAYLAAVPDLGLGLALEGRGWRDPRRGGGVARPAGPSGRAGRDGAGDAGAVQGAAAAQRRRPCRGPRRRRRRMAAILTGQVAGVDEVGRGPLAGPVVVAAVILRRPLGGTGRFQAAVGSRRSRTEPLIRAARPCGARGGVRSRDRALNILGATMLAMRRAVGAAGRAARSGAGRRQPAAAAGPAGALRGRGRRDGAGDQRRLDRGQGGCATR